MNKILLDDNVLRALIEENHNKHQLTEDMIKTIDTYTFYIPEHIFTKTMNLCTNCNNKIKKKIGFTLTNTCRIQHLSPAIYNNSLKKYNHLHSLTYSDCLTIEFMKEKEIKNILSYNEKLDNITEINRVYDFDKYNKKKLNFIKYIK